MKWVSILLVAMGLCGPSFALPNEICNVVSAAAAAPDPDDAFWEASGLEFRHLRVIVENRIANADEEGYLMGLYTLNSLLAWREHRWVLVPSNIDLANLPPGKIVHTIENVAFFEVGDEVNFYKLWDHLRPHWRAKFQAGEKINFDKLFEWTVPRCNQAPTGIMVAEALNAGFSVRDPHSRITPTSEVTSARQSMGQQFTGVGMQVSLDRNHRLWVRGFYPGASIATAGLRPRDEILKIDGVKVRDLNRRELHTKLEGTIGQVHIFSIRRGNLNIEVSTIFEAITIPHALPRTFNTDGGAIGHLRIDEFRSSSLVEQTRKAIEQFHVSGAKGLVLDLRGNPGGDATITAEFLGLFLGPDVLVYSQMSVFTHEKKPLLTFGEKATELPMLVLVDENTVSAAEASAAALQQHGRAMLVGERTFGKGTVQAAHTPDPNGPFGSMGITYYSTIAYYLTPHGTSPQIHGVPPDFLVHFAPDVTDTELHFMRERDVFYNALPNPGKPVELPYRKERTDIFRCLAQTGRAQQTYYSPRVNDADRDYQLLFAADVMRCLWRL